MPSINLIKSSDGTGNIPLITVQSVRSPGATTIVVNTVENLNATFMGSMGTPHTFIDPVTAEEITVISEATCVDFTGSVSGTNIEITSIAPGFTDLGNKVGDVIVIKPTTEWANNIANVLAVTHNQDGNLKDSIVTSYKLGAPQDVIGANLNTVTNGKITFGYGYNMNHTPALVGSDWGDVVNIPHTNANYGSQLFASPKGLFFRNYDNNNFANWLNVILYQTTDANSWVVTAANGMKRYTKSFVSTLGNINANTNFTMADNWPLPAGKTLNDLNLVSLTAVSLGNSPFFAYAMESTSFANTTIQIYCRNIAPGPVEHKQTKILVVFEDRV